MSRFILCENKKKIVKEIMISRIRSLLVVLTMVVVLFNSSISLQAEEYEYDVLDRVVKVSYEDGSYVEYEYDDNGNIISINVYDVNQTQVPDNGETEESGDSNISAGTAGGIARKMLEHAIETFINFLKSIGRWS